MEPAAVEASIDVAAPIAAVFGVISDPRRLGEWSLELTDADWTGRWSAPEVGARFLAGMRLGRFTPDRTCEVVEHEPPTVHAWRTRPTTAMPESTLWRFVLHVVDGGTRIDMDVQTLRRNPVIGRLIHRVATHRTDPEATARQELIRLAGLFEPPPVDAPRV